MAALFDAYRQFYEQEADLQRATAFLRERMEKSESVLVVAENEDREMLGFCQLYPSFCSVVAAPICILSDLFVKPEARKSGLGEALLRSAERYAQENGFARMELTTAKTNLPAQSLYESLGWERDEIFYAYSKQLHFPRSPRLMNSEPTADREFVHSRLIDAPQERVFAAFSDPARLARWWGPNGFTSTFEVFDFRPGGLWRFVLHGPDGKDYPNESVFREVEPPGKVVFEHFSGHHFFMTITFSAQGDQTLVGWRQLFDTAEHAQHIAKVVSEANEQNLSRLAAEVARVV